jgi:DNA-binding MarR family transcriptional regulator
MSRPDYALDDQIGYLLRRVSQRHLAIFARQIPEITTTQFAVLARLAELGPQSQNALGRETAMDGATIKGVVDRLAKQGLVATAPDSADRRRISVDLTAQGRALFDRLAPLALQVTAATLAPLTDDETDVLTRLLMRLT